MKLWIIGIWLEIFCYLKVSFNKTIRKTINVNALSNEPWKSITKFAMDIGTGRYEIRAKLSGHHMNNSSISLPVPFSVYLDEQWSTVLTLST